MSLQFSACITTNNIQPEKAGATLQITDYSIEENSIILVLEIANNTKDTISILKPRPIKNSNNFAPSSLVSPDFFSVEFPNQKSKCIITEPNNSSTRDIKTLTDILVIPPYSLQKFNLNCSDYDQFYCNEKIINVQVNYEINEQILNKEYFYQNIVKKGGLDEIQSKKLFVAISSTYKNKLTATTTITQE